MKCKNAGYLAATTLFLFFGMTTHLLADSHPQQAATDDRHFFQKYDLYRTPVVPTPSESDRTKNCYALEHEIASLVPKTYSYKPDFYNDPYQGISVFVGTAVFMPAYALSGYAGYRQYIEDERIISAEERIEVLRHLKAQNRCFET